MANPNFKNHTLWTGDNLHVMRGLNSETIDLIYLDPPFNSNKDYSAPIGSEAAGAAFKDTWTLSDVDLAWHGEIAEANPGLYGVIDAARQAHGTGMQSYLIMMAVRLLEMKPLLKPTGSIYLHCDPVASHYLKLVMDTVFGASNFKNEIIWRIGWVSGFKTQKRGWIRNHDTLLYYMCSPQAADRFNKEYSPYPKDYVRRDGKKPTGKGIPIEDTWNSSSTDILDSIMIKSFFKEKVGYPTQKPLALLERIIKASSTEGDLVLDPFCGCATALVASERLNRQWIGIDISAKAKDLIRLRVRKDLGLFSFKAIYRDDVPMRTDMGKLPAYQTHKNMLYGQQEGLCTGCQTLFPIRNLTIDHIVARSRGGSDHLENLQLLCGACNSTKGSKTQEEFLAQLKKDGIR